jgi:hypothetical protein
MSAAVEHLSGGWITVESVEEEQGPRSAANHDSFEERLQRELAKLTPQASEAAEPAPPEPAPPLAPAPTDYVPAARPVMRGPQGFGRKIV